MARQGMLMSNGQYLGSIHFGYNNLMNNGPFLICRGSEWSPLAHEQARRKQNESGEAEREAHAPPEMGVATVIARFKRHYNYESNETGGTLVNASRLTRLCNTKCYSFNSYQIV